MKYFFVAPVIRPAVVMYDELIDEMSQIQACSFANGKANLVIVSGTSLQFPYLIEFMAYAVAGGARVLYIDPEATSDVPLYMLTNPDLAQALFQMAPHTHEIRPRGLTPAPGMLLEQAGLQFFPLPGAEIFRIELKALSCSVVVMAISGEKKGPGVPLVKRAATGPLFHDRMMTV